MRARNKLFLLVTMGSMMLLSTGLNYAQTESAAETAAEPEIQWLWGEALSVDENAQNITVKYFDYETDAEKEINISADAKTLYENVKSLTEIKPLDTLSIDYIVSSDGKNIAKNISVEQAEISPQIFQEEPAVEGKPEASAPSAQQ